LFETIFIASIVDGIWRERCSSITQIRTRIQLLVATRLDFGSVSRARRRCTRRTLVRVISLISAIFRKNIVVQAQTSDKRK